VAGVFKDKPGGIVLIWGTGDGREATGVGREEEAQGSEHRAQRKNEI